MTDAHPPEVRAAIEAGKREYDRTNPPGPGVLPRDQWQVVPDDEGHRPYFTEEEVARGAEAFLPKEGARAYAGEVYADEIGFCFPEDLLSAIALGSPELAERVRVLLRETPEQARTRMEEFRARLDAWHAEGAPVDGFPEKPLHS